MRREPDAPRSARRRNFSRKPSGGSSAAAVDGQPCADANGRAHPPGGSAKQSQLRVWGGREPFLPLKRGGSFEQQSISSAPRAKRTHLSRAESCKGKRVAQRLQGPGAGELGSAGVQGTSPSPLPRGHLPGPSGALAGSPLLPSAGARRWRGSKCREKRQMKVNECLKAANSSVRGERGTRPPPRMAAGGATILGPRDTPPGKNFQTPPPSSPVFLSPALSLF